MTMRKLSVKLLFVVLLAGGLLAWSQATTGSISGRVTDSTDRVIEGAKVSIQAVETGLITTAVTNNSGEFIETAMRRITTRSPFRPAALRRPAYPNSNSTSIKGRFSILRSGLARPPRAWSSTTLPLLCRCRAEKQDR